MGSSAERSRPQSLPKCARVRKRSDFLHVQSAGRRVPTRHFLVVHLAGHDGPARLGITVTKKIGNAVVRNRVKRCVRESFRTRRSMLPQGTTVVVIARDGAGKLGAREVADELAPAFARIAGDRSSAQGSSARAQ
ncbi:MAG TPA: ribonuclease P protein component [Candidatus Binatia bacterium]